MEKYGEKILAIDQKRIKKIIRDKEKKISTKMFLMK